MKRSLYLLALAGLLACTGEEPIDDTDDDTDDTEAEGDTNNSPETATPVTFTDGAAAIPDAIAEPGDQDWFAIEAQAGVWYMLHAARDNPAGGDPDTVVQVYDSTGTTLVAENDDLPYRWHDTDGGTVFKATESATYYAKVLEWGDWAGEGAGGSDQFTYRLIAYEVPFEEALTVNDSVADVVAALETFEDDETANDMPIWWQNPISLWSFGPGTISEAADVDFYGDRFEASAPGTCENCAVCTYGLWPGLPTDLEPTLTVLDGAGVEITTAADPFPGLFESVFYPGGVTLPIGRDGGDVIIEVDDKDDEGGSNHIYALNSACYPSVFEPEGGDAYTQIHFDDESVDDNVMVMRESTAVDGAYFLLFTGTLDAADDVDEFTFTDGVADATKLTLVIDSAKSGSVLEEIKVSVLDQASTSLGGDTGADPSFTDLSEADGEDERIDVSSATGITIRVEHGTVDTDFGPGAFYHGYVAVQP